MKRAIVSKDKRETQDIFINGYILTLVKGRKDQKGIVKQPCYCGKQGWALLSVVKMKRTK